MWFNGLCYVHWITAHAQQGAAPTKEKAAAFLARQAGARVKETRPINRRAGNEAEPAFLGLIHSLHSISCNSHLCEQSAQGVPQHCNRGWGHRAIQGAWNGMVPLPFALTPATQSPTAWQISRSRDTTQEKATTDSLRSHEENSW
jgi:hypothetical protein